MLLLNYSFLAYLCSKPRQPGDVQEKSNKRKNISGPLVTHSPAR